MHYFITSTGTDIGKTFITCIIARFLMRHSATPAIAKPIMSGVTDIYDNDAAHLLRAIHQPVTEASLNAISPWRYAAPLSPHRAAELAGENIDIPALLTWCNHWVSTYCNRPCLMEGAGGIATPLSYQYTTLDWLRDLCLPLIMVVGDYLGTLSHTLTALHAASHAGLKVAAIIVNESPISPDHAATCATLAQLSPYSAPVLSFTRMDDAALEAWEDDTRWQNSSLYLQHSNFFRNLSEIMLPSTDE
jgi:dethiobiotin synthetase